jgi:hypothetical protein
VAPAEAEEGADNSLSESNSLSEALGVQVSSDRLTLQPNTTLVADLWRARSAFKNEQFLRYRVTVLVGLLVELGL